ncbi:unnamed protein product, partial [Owenia fusiformis]
MARSCDICKEDVSVFPNLIIPCDSCQKRYHGDCHKPFIPFSRICQKERWSCQICRTRKVEQTSRQRSTLKLQPVSNGLHRHENISVHQRHVSKGTNINHRDQNTQSSSMLNCLERHTVNQRSNETDSELSCTSVTINTTMQADKHKSTGISNKCITDVLLNENSILNSSCDIYKINDGSMTSHIQGSGVKEEKSHGAEKTRVSDNTNRGTVYTQCDKGIIKDVKGDADGILPAGNVIAKTIVHLEEQKLEKQPTDVVSMSENLCVVMEKPSMKKTKSKTLINTKAIENLDQGRVSEGSSLETGSVFNISERGDIDVTVTDQSISGKKRHIDEAISDEKRHIAEKYSEGKRHIDGTISEKRQFNEKISEGKRHIDGTISYQHITEGKRHIDETIPKGKRHIDETTSDGRRHIAGTISYQNISEGKGHIDEAISEGKRHNNDSASEKRYIDQTSNQKIVERKRYDNQTNQKVFERRRQSVEVVYPQKVSKQRRHSVGTIRDQQISEKRCLNDTIYDRIKNKKR